MGEPAAIRVRIGRSTNRQLSPAQSDGTRCHDGTVNDDRCSAAIDNHGHLMPCTLSHGARSGRDALRTTVRESDQFECTTIGLAELEAIVVIPSCSEHGVVPAIAGGVDHRRDGERRSDGHATGQSGA